MKPNFALSLSFEGIRLLHRAAGGWRIVGEVGLDTDDLPGELAVLRRTATALDPGGLRSKLLLPEGQIKYLTLDTPDMDDAARAEAARAALDGATPYAVDDLAFDVSVEGDKTHVAAVARETLAEAEAFASEHRFNPVSFASVPGAAGYLGEPFFGPTRAANALLQPGEKIEPDGIAVVVVGNVSPQDAPIVEAEEEAAAAEPQEPAPRGEEPTASEPEDPDPKETKAAEPATDASASETENTGSPAAAAAGVSAEEAPAVFKSRLTKPDPIDISDTPEPETEGSPAAPPLAATDIDDVPPMPAFHSLGAATRDAPAATKPAPAAPAQPGFASRRGTGNAPDRREPVVSTPVTRPATEPEFPLATDSMSGEEKDSVAARMAPAISAARSTASAAAAPIGRFLSRRRTNPTPVNAQPAAVAPAPRSEAERMTVFGERRGDVGGKPRFLGLMLTAALLIFLAGVAAWASVFLDDGLNLSRLFGEREPARTASAPADPPELEAPEDIQTAALDAGLTEEDTAVLDALREPVAPQIVELTPQELEAKYAATGIWPKAPDVPPEPAGVMPIDDLYLTSIDPVSTANDAVALPTSASFGTDTVIDAVPSPAAAGTTFALNEQGLVIATASGALSPDGYTVFLGSPPVVPPAMPTRFQAAPQDDGVRSALAAFRPRERPGDLSEQNERANLDGLTRSELADFRPRLRPKSVQEQAEEAAAPQAPESPDTDAAVQAAMATPEQTAFENATPFATQASLRPDTRPRNFSRIVQRAQRTEQRDAEQETRVASAATLAPRAVQPKIPSNTSVAKQATVRNAINLRKVNLIGVYGKPSNRRALVRLGNGRYQKVVVGDRVDGGRVTAIGDSELRYRKSGRDIVLKMPRS